MGCAPTRRGKSPLKVMQLFERESSTYTYLVASNGECILIDPVDVTYERDLKIIEQCGYKLKYCINTHVHADHITGSGLIKQKLPEVKSVISKNSLAKADKMVDNGDVIQVGKEILQVRATPGHTNGCISLVLNPSDPHCVFTGDALLIGGCGRTDFQQGDPAVLYESVKTQILSLPSETLIYPGHDYQGRTCSTVEEENKYNPRLTLPKKGFVEFMNKRFDGSNYPGRIDEALPANMACGFPENVEEAVEKKETAEEVRDEW
ncbi:hypothetical protein AAMO2058_001621600 [Amorphochlora amoebiformis]